jgi:hypothetical protein
VALDSGSVALVDRKVVARHDPSLSYDLVEDSSVGVNHENQWEKEISDEAKNIEPYLVLLFVLRECRANIVVSGIAPAEMNQGENYRGYPDETQAEKRSLFGHQSGVSQRMHDGEVTIKRDSHEMGDSGNRSEFQEDIRCDTKRPCSDHVACNECWDAQQPREKIRKSKAGQNEVGNTPQKLLPTDQNNHPSVDHDDE